MDRIGSYISSDKETGLNYEKITRVSVYGADDTIEDQLVSTDSDSYINTSLSNLSDLFMPFAGPSRPEGSYVPMMSGAEMPDMDSSDINMWDMLPFKYDADATGVVNRMHIEDGGTSDSMQYLSGDRHGGKPRKYRHDKYIRGMGLRLPLVGVGWGYTTDGNPWPSGTSTDQFRGDTDNGWEVDPKDYQAAPIDIRYDTEKGMWVATGGTMARHQHLQNTAGDGGPAFASFFRG